MKNSNNYSLIKRFKHSIFNMSFSSTSINRVGFSANYYPATYKQKHQRFVYEDSPVLIIHFLKTRFFIYFGEPQFWEQNIYTKNTWGWVDEKGNSTWKNY